MTVRTSTGSSVALVLTGLILVAANLRTALTSVGPVVPALSQDLGLSSFATSALISLPLFAFAVISPLAPRISVRLGLERTLTLGLVVLAAGLIIRSTPPQALLWVGTALIGIAIAVLNVLLPALVKKDFPERIGQITGIYSAVQASFAALAAGIAVPVAGLTDLGWRLSLGLWAGLALIALGVMLPLLRNRRRIDLTAETVTLPGGPVRGQSPWKSMIGWQVSAFMGLQSTVYFVVITWLPSIEAAAGISETAAGAHQSMFNASAIIGSLVCSALIAKLGDQRILGTALPILLLFSTAGVMIAPHWAALWASLIGVGCGGAIVLALSFIGLRSRNHSQAAALSGMTQSVGYLLAALGPIAIGSVFDITGSWNSALAILIVAEIILIGVGYLAGRDRTLG